MFSNIINNLLPSMNTNKENAQGSAFRCLIPFLRFALIIAKFGIKLFSACSLAACHCLEEQLNEQQNGGKKTGYSGTIDPVGDIGKVIDAGAGSLVDGLVGTITETIPIPDVSKIPGKLVESGIGTGSKVVETGIGAGSKTIEAGIGTGSKVIESGIGTGSKVVGTAKEIVDGFIPKLLF